MKQSNNLNYSKKQTKATKNFKSFVISFAAFVVVLGTVSLLMFMKSLNFNLKNLVSGSQENTTEANEQESTQSAVVDGGVNVVVLCSNPDGDLSFSFLMETDYSEMKTQVVYIPITLTASYNGVTASMNSHFVNGSADTYVKAFEEYSGIEVDRYILVNETQFKNFLAKFEDVTVNVPKAIDGKKSNGLILNKGKQNLTSDLLLKYIKYADNNEKTKAFCNMLSVVFDKKNEVSLDKLFSYLINNSQSDISIIDYTNEKDKIVAYMNSQGEYVPLETLGELIGETK